jgi:hypothetical protein
MKQHGYLKAKAQRLCDILGGVSKVTYYTAFIVGGSEDGYEKCRVVKTSKRLEPLRELLYPNGKKTVTLDALNAVTEEGLAYWFLDDGHTKWDHSPFRDYVTTGSAILAVCQPLEQMNLIKNYLLERWGLYSKIVTVNNNLMLTLDNTSAHRLRSIVAPFTPRCMQYKIDPKQAKMPTRKALLPTTTP